VVAGREARGCSGKGGGRKGESQAEREVGSEGGREGAREGGSEGGRKGGDGTRSISLISHFLPTNFLNTYTQSLIESVESVGFDASLLHPSPSPSSSSTTTIPNHPPLAPPSCRGKGGGEAGKEEEEEGGPDYVLEIEGMMCMKSCGTTGEQGRREVGRGITVLT